MEEKKMKTAVVDVGGGMRGVYASGVLDRCLKEDVQFDLCIGVSAGSANLASYLSGQMGRNLFFYHDYAFSEGIHEPAQFFPHPFLRRFGIHLRYLEQSGRRKCAQLFQPPAPSGTVLGGGRGSGVRQAKIFHQGGHPAG